MENPTDFWSEYDWKWASPSDVAEFVAAALETETYTQAREVLEYDETWQDQWWYMVDSTIENMVSSFTKGDLFASVGYLLNPMLSDDMPMDGGDHAIFSSVMKHLPGFPAQFPNGLSYLTKYYEEWCEFSWHHIESRTSIWTFYGTEILAKSPYVPAEFLRRIFEESFWNLNNGYEIFRVRIGLAMNPNSPKEILDFLFANANSDHWLLKDPDEIGVINKSSGKYEINLNTTDDSILANYLNEAKQINNFDYPTSEYMRDAPGYEYLENLFDIQWEASNAGEALLAAFARNTSLDEGQYRELFKSDHPLVRYYLSKNQALPKDLKELLEVEKPTFTYLPYDGEVGYIEEETLT